MAELTVKTCDCAILLFAIPQHYLHEESELLDEITGHHGYAHMGVECCNSGGQPFMIDASYVRGHIAPTPIAELQREDRPTLYGRIPVKLLGHLAIDCAEFCRKAHELLDQGLPYSMERVRHLLEHYGLLLALVADPPVKGLMCSDVLQYCLPDEVVRRIVRFGDSTQPDTVATGMGSDNEVFFTPNALALALGLPHARTLTRPGQELVPTLFCAGPDGS